MPSWPPAWALVFREPRLAAFLAPVSMFPLGKRDPDGRQWACCLGGGEGPPALKEECSPGWTCLPPALLATLRSAQMMGCREGRPAHFHRRDFWKHLAWRPAHDRHDSNVSFLSPSPNTLLKRNNLTYIILLFFYKNCFFLIISNIYVRYRP